MLVSIGSHNPVKLAATRSGFTTVWPAEEWHFEAVDVAPGVSGQPMCNAESIRGARNRGCFPWNGVGATMTRSVTIARERTASR